MFKRFLNRNAQTDAINEQIAAVLREMETKGVTSEDYPKLMRYLNDLNGVKAKESRTPVSRDTVALVVGNLLGILLIVAYENKHVMTSKAFSQIIRLKGQT